MLYKKVNKALNWGVKVASLAVTGPATWLVAGNLFQDIHDPTTLFLMRTSAVFLIEGVMLSNWLLLEYNKRATPGIKARYGLTALAMYTALIVIAWQHEGPTGLVFRIALLAALLGSGWDTYVYTWQKATAKADKDISHTRVVRKHRRKLAILDAKETLTVAHEVAQAQRQVDKHIQLETIKSDSWEQLALLEQKHTDLLSSLEKTDDESTGYLHPFRISKEQALDRMLDIYQAKPDASLREVAAKIGRSHQTVADYLDLLESEGKVCRNGAGIEVVGGS